MVQIDLTPEERQVLSEVLDGYLSDLRMEIADTDRLDYRNLLKMRKQIVTKALTALQIPGPAPAG